MSKARWWNPNYRIYKTILDFIWSKKLYLGNTWYIRYYLLTRLWLSFSHLSGQKFRHTFKDSINSNMQFWFQLTWVQLTLRVNFVQVLQFHRDRYFFGYCSVLWCLQGVTGQIIYLSTGVSSIWYSMSFLISSASFLLFSPLLVGNNFFLITFVNVVLYFDLYCLSSFATFATLSICLDFSMPNVVFNLSLFSGLFLLIHWNDLMIAGNLSVKILNGMPWLLKRDDIVLKRTTLTLPTNCFIDSSESFFSPLLLENNS